MVFDAADGEIFLYYSLNTHKLDVYARKGRKFEEIFHPGRRHSKRMQNLPRTEYSGEPDRFRFLARLKAFLEFTVCRFFRVSKYVKCSLLGLDVVDALRLLP